MVLTTALTRGTSNIKLTAKNFESVKTRSRVAEIAVRNAGANRKTIQQKFIPMKQICLIHFAVLVNLEFLVVLSTKFFDGRRKTL